MDTKLTAPTNDPSLPSFVHPVLADLQEDLQRAYDAFNYLRGVKMRYLPQESAEPDDAYRQRLDRAVFAGFFRDSVEAFAGILSRFSLKDPPTTMETAIDNIDLEGNSLTAFWMWLDCLMLRDGGCAICVEMPPDLPATAAEEAAQERRPYLVARQRSKVLNWRTTVDYGVETIDQVTFLEAVEVPDSMFGIKSEPRYRVITRGEWFVFKIDRDSSNQVRATIVEQGTYIGADGRPLPVVPVVWYGSEQAGFGHSGMPLRQVVEHSLEHFQVRSDLSEKTHRCAMPVPVRIGAAPPAPGDSRRKGLTLGPNTIIDLEPGGSFTFAEPSANSLREQREQIADIEKLIARQTLGFLYGDPGGVKTATQAGLESAQTQAGITKLAQRKSSAMQAAMVIWCLYTGEQLEPGSGIQMSNTIYDRPLEPQDIQTLQMLAGGAELISQQTAIEELQRAGVIKATTSVEDEMARINAERPLPADDVGLNDYGALPADQET